MKLTLAARIRVQGDVSARPGQMDLLYEIASEVEALQAESDRMRLLLGELGFCPKDGDPMPCLTCGAGL